MTTSDQLLHVAYAGDTAPGNGGPGKVRDQDVPHQHGSGESSPMSKAALTGGEKMLLTTRAQLIADLRAAGIAEGAIMAVAQATAPARHERRVAEVLTALGGVPTVGPARARFVMQLICELHGVGGTADLSGSATLRMPWARGLGKGRKHAMDGSAWAAAILDAFKRSYRQFLLPQASEHWLTVIRPEVLGFAVALDAEGNGRALQELGTWIPAPDEARWACALALRALLGALELPAPAPAEPFARIMPHLAFDGSAIAWSRLVERLEESKAAAESHEREAPAGIGGVSPETS